MIRSPIAERKVLDTLRHPASGIALFMLFGGLVSLLAGTDTNWDLKNYHFYNPWAWLNHRLLWDYAPAQLQSYHSPFLDLPFYGLVRIGTPAVIVTFLMGIPYGVAVYFLYRIAGFIVADLQIQDEPLALAAIGTVALTGAAGLSQVGSTMNEWTTASMVMAALFVLVRGVRSANSLSVRDSALAGLLAGAAAGLKLTASIFAPALFAALVLCLAGRRNCMPGVVAFCIAGTAGFLISYGYWAIVLWEHFQNPFFPYFNDIFRSEYWEPRAILDDRFRPKKLGHWLTLPFRISERGKLVGEAEMRDLRLAFLCVFAGVLALVKMRQAKEERKRLITVARDDLPASVRLVTVFALVSYLAWLVIFSIYRYTIPLELTGSLLLVLAMRAAFRAAAHRNLLIGAFCVLIVATTAVPNWGRAQLHSGSYFAVQVPPVPRESLVLIFTFDPLGYVVPFLEPSARVLRPTSNFTNPAYTNRLQREMADLIAAQSGPMFVVRYSNGTDPQEEAALPLYGLRRNDAGCRAIESNLDDKKLVICPLIRR